MEAGQQGDSRRTRWWTVFAISFLLLECYCVCYCWNLLNCTLALSSSSWILLPRILWDACLVAQWCVHWGPHRFALKYCFGYFENWMITLSSSWMLLPMVGLSPMMNELSEAREWIWKLGYAGFTKMVWLELVKGFVRFMWLGLHSRDMAFHTGMRIELCFMVFLTVC